jgi:hypothetical protein
MGYNNKIGASADGERKKILEELETKLTKTETKASHYEEKYSSATKTVNSLKAGIGSIFTKVIDIIAIMFVL